MKKVILDAVDVRILSAVQQHGQISKSRLSELVSLSPTPCWMRLDKLKKAGLIKGFRGDIAIDKILDLTKVYVTVSLKAHNRSNFERFEKRILSVDEIIECSATGGGCDYVMKVITNSLTDFQNLIEQLLDEEIGIDRYYIYVVTREVKSTTLSLSKLIADKARSSE
ncbi:transcriptional regulator, AsnC family [Amphritea atlantica]|uniref:Transcriptional regulator, AsnC family n=1 Tax=Amphritea atlantica TaxID=355243 RepID=A0A1H9J0E7_9GAMM|nr:Lrp/AsnC family transcriptional regulator [Amphritea atlantica]SEQ80239.1 transcriptional regulator, AsnC family [Amphritea atlantica]